MNKLYFFGYGSLIFPGGINGRGMAYLYRDSDLTEIVVDGYKREWNVTYNWNRKESYRYYGLSKDEDSSVPGVMFEVHDERDFAALKRSEGGDDIYEYIDITEDVRGSSVILPDGAKVITCLTKNPSEEGIIPEYYKKVVKNGLSKRSEFFRRAFGHDPNLETEKVGA